MEAFWWILVIGLIIIFAFTRWLLYESRQILIDEIEDKVLDQLTQDRDRWWKYPEMLEAIGHPGKARALTAAKRRLKSQGLIEEMWVEDERRPWLIFKLKRARPLGVTAPIRQ